MSAARFIPESARCVALAALLVSGASAAQSAAQIAQQAGTAPPSTSLLDRFAGTTVSLAQEIGVGTFVNNPYSDDPFMDTTVGITGRFRLDGLQFLAASWRFAYEQTQPNNATGRRYAISDVSLGYLNFNVYKEPVTGIRLTGVAFVALPTSPESQFNRTLFNVTAGPGLVKTFFENKLIVSYSSRFTKFLPQSPNRGLTPDSPIAEDADSARSAQVSIASAYCRDDAAFCTGGALNTNFSISNSLGVTYMISSNLFASASFAISNSWRFAVPEQFSDPNLPRVGRGDMTSGSLSLSYQATDHLNLSAGVSSSQPALTSDNRGLRFPFYDFISPSNNFTIWSLSASATL